MKFRNRLAHNEPVFSTRTGFAERLGDVRKLLGLVAPDVASFVTAHSTVASVLHEGPVQGLIG